MKVFSEKIKDWVKHSMFQRVKWKRLLFLLCLAVFMFSVYKIANQLWDYKKSEMVYSEIKNIYYNQQDPGVNHSNVDKAQCTTDAAASYTFDSPAPSSVFQTGDPSTPGTVYKDQRIERQAFNKLWEINKDIVGWIKIPGIKVDYPVLKGHDNDYYLTHSVNHAEIRNASIFMDYRNNIKKLDFNTIIYGHNMHDGSMFGYLPMYKEDWFFQKYPYVYFDTANAKGKWEVFSVYVTDTEFNYLKTGFNIEEECRTFINTIKSKSIFKKDMVVTPEDRILTLSTCSYEFKNARTVVHAKLVKP